MIDPGGLSAYEAETLPLNSHPPFNGGFSDEAGGVRLGCDQAFPARADLRDLRRALRCRSLARLALADAPPPHPSRSIRAPSRPDGRGAARAPAGEGEVFGRGHPLLRRADRSARPPLPDPPPGRAAGERARG